MKQVGYLVAVVVDRARGTVVEPTNQNQPVLHAFLPEQPYTYGVRVDLMVTIKVIVANIL